MRLPMIKMTRSRRNGQSACSEGRLICKTLRDENDSSNTKRYVPSGRSSLLDISFMSIGHVWKVYEQKTCPNARCLPDYGNANTDFINSCLLRSPRNQGIKAIVSHGEWLNLRRHYAHKEGTARFLRPRLIASLLVPEPK